MSRSVILFLRSFLFRFGLAGLSRFALLSDPIGKPAGEIDQRLAREEHGDCGGDAGGRQRPGAHRIDGIFGEVGAFFLGTLPCILGEHLRAQPLLQLLRRSHHPRPAALDLRPRGKNFS